jgi:hypothetical protein
MQRREYNTVTLPILYECNNGTSIPGISGTRVRALPDDWKDLSNRFVAAVKSADGNMQEFFAFLREAQKFKELPDWQQAARKAKNYPDQLVIKTKEWLCTAITNHLWNNVHLVITYQRGELKVALLCTSVGIALFVRALFRFAGGLGIVICPKCGTPFFQQRSDQDYCSPKHRETHRIQLWREKQRRKKRRKR